MAYDKMWCTLTWEDVHGRYKTKRIEMATVDATQAEIDAQAIAAAYEAATEGIVRKAIVSGEMRYAGPASAGSNVDTGVTCTVQLSLRPDRAYLKWPMPMDSYILPGGVVNVADALVQAVQNLYIPLSGVAKLSDGETIDSILSGLLDK